MGEFCVGEATAAPERENLGGFGGIWIKRERGVGDVIGDVIDTRIWVVSGRFWVVSRRFWVNSGQVA